MMLIATAAISYNVMHTTKVKAEGTKDMVKNAGYRAYTEWTSNDTYASIPRQTKLNVFVNAGETINLGSSVIVSNPAKDYEIYVTKPNGTRTGYHVDKNTGLGYIDSVQKEAAGPNPSSGGYTPIAITADTTGVWKVEFRGSGKHADDPTEPGYYDSNGVATNKNTVEWDAKSVRASSAIQKVTDDFISAQGNTIGAWDITVKDMTGNERKGRVFTSYVSLFVGKNSSINGTAATASAAEKVINSDFYVLTKDGYVYKTSMNGLDPNGFLFFSNNRGFIDSTNNMTLYHSVAEDKTAATNDGTSNTLKHILGNVSPQRPDVADTATDITHNVFFSYPSQDLPSNLSPQAIAPAVPQNFNFTGNTGTQSKTQLSNGGTFSFVADKASSYRLVIDTDGTGGFNLATDKVIENVCVAGKNTVTWDGTDKSGKKLPVGSYSAHLIMKGGEYHFPMLDAEHNPFGIKVQLMNAPGYTNPSDYTDKYKVYYDESNYTTSNNTIVNLDASNTKYNINPISALNGIDSSNGANAYFQNFGDVKGIDTWTYFPGQAVDLTFEVTPTVSDFSKSGNEDTNITFAATDFINKFQAGTNNNLSKIQIKSLPSNGQLKLNGNAVTLNQEISVDDLNNLVFVPNKNWNGNVSFDWIGSNGTVYSANTAKANITIIPVNDAPTAVNDTASTNEKTPVIIRVLDNDSDVEGDSLRIISSTSPLFGKVVVNLDGTITYTPYVGFHGNDAFTYTISDANGGTATATVNVIVNAMPVVSNYDKKADFNTPLNDKVVSTDADGDSLTFEKASDPVHGSLVVNNDGTWTYSPNKNFSGADSFTVKVNDGHGDTAVSTISITVDTPPAVSNYDKSTDFNKSVSDKVIATDANGDSLTYSKESDPSHGTVVVNSDGTWRYTPNKDFSGADSFNILVSDGHGGTVISTISVTVDTSPSVGNYDKSVDFNKSVSDKVIATDVNGDTLTYSKESDPSHGTVVVNNDGTWTYTPNKDFSGTDSFKVLVNDGHGGTAVSTVNLKVDSSPIVSNYGEKADFNKPVSDKIIATDVDGDSLTYSKASDPTHGTVVVNEDGTWTYTPSKDFSGTDSFTVKVDDGHGGSATSLVMIKVNTPPMAVDDFKAINQDNSAVIDVLGNDIDVDKDLLSVITVSQPQHGKAVVNGDGTITYTPNTGYSGTEDFTYTISDGHNGTATAHVTIKVNAIPVIPSFYKEVNVNSQLRDKVIASDADIEDVLTYAKASNPSHGSVVVNADGSYVYTPDTDYVGYDSFTIIVSDDHGGTAISTINIRINSIPTLTNYDEKADFNKTVSDKLVGEDKDGDRLTYSKISDPSHGTVVVNNDGTWTYTPNKDFSGTDSFKVQVEDGHGGVVTANVTVKVDTPPIAVNDEAKTNESTTVKIDVLSNDSDLDKDSLSIVSVYQPQHGKVVVNTDGTLSYTPNAGYHGKESFTYTISDGRNGISSATVNVDVNATPVVESYDEKTDYNKAVSGKVVGSDADGDVLTYSKAGAPSHGTVTVNKDGTWLYTPDKDFSGTDSFTVKVEDGKGVYTISTVKIIVDTPPVAINDSVTTDEDTSVNINILNNDKDVNNDALTVTAVTNPSHGNVAINPDGTVKYTPVANYNGNDSFTYTISDGHGGTATATVNIIINPVNDAPTAPNYDKTTPYNKSISSRVQGTDIDGDTLQYTLKSQASNGYVTVSSNGTWTYTPNLNYAGSDSFTVEVSDGHGKTVISTINITVRDRADLVGTVRNISTGKVVPNATIQLIDLAGRLIYTTTSDAQGNYAINNVKLGIYDFKVSNSQYKTINDEFDVEPSSETNYAVRKDFQVSDALAYSLNLTASPNTILGDGISTSVLTTRVVDSNNNPVANVQVNFSADGGSFPNGAVAVTDKDGVARVIFKSANVSGTDPQKIHVSASVDDKAHNLQAFDQIIMTFEPGVIVGVVIDNDTNLPISNAVVEVSKDFDGDGIADFYSKVITGADGKYTIAIPRGNTDYKVEITKPVKVGNTYENVKFTQNSKVGEITGSKTEQYSSEETVAGVILSKQTDGKVAMLKDDSLFSIEVLNKADGSSAGNVKASFVNGVFEAEGLEKGKSYTIAINYTFPSGQRIAIGTANVNVNTDGQINLTSMLIDPYGTITDSITNGIIDGVKVQLYYADTERNRAAGRTPNTLVDLPKVPGFAPADNENPQIDDVNGKYAFMVFPEADYYLVATKDGYDTFVSETISVEKNIVKRDISMNQVKKPTVTTPIVSKPVEPTKETPQPEKTATIIQELPKTGSVVDFNTLSILGLMMVASGVGITLTKKKN
jgi:LPXTG-motif cell wall-anchored protein